MKITDEMVERAREMYATFGQHGHLRAAVPSIDVVTAMPTAALAVQTQKGVEEEARYANVEGFVRLSEVTDFVAKWWATEDGHIAMSPTDAAQYIKKHFASGSECRHCNGKGYQAGDPEGAPIEDCDYCGGIGYVAEMGGMKLFGHWSKHRLADGVFLPLVCYVPTGPDYTTVPLYAPSTPAAQASAAPRSALVDVPAVESEPVAWRPSYQQIKDVVQENVNRMQQAGESHLMMARWLSADIDKLYAHPPRSLSNEGWMPIETAPKDGSAMLLGHEGAAFDGWWEADGRETDTGEPGWIDGLMNNIEEYTTLHPTHWMHLPTPPLSTRKGSAGDGAATGTKGAGE